MSENIHEAKVLQPITAFRTVTWWWCRCWPVRRNCLLGFVTTLF